MLFTRQVQKKICFSFYLEPNSNSSCAVSGFPGLKLFTMAKNLNVSIVLRIILTFLLQSSGLPKNTERWKKVQLFLWLCMSLSDNRVTCEAFLFCVESCFWQQRYYFIGVLMKLTAVFFSSELKSILHGWRVCEQACLCVDTFMNVRVCVSVGVYGFADVSRGQNNTSTEIQTQQLCRTQKRVTLLQVFFQGVGFSESISVCLCMHVCVCVQVEVGQCVDICKTQLYPS